MTIALGRRRLVLSLISDPRDGKSIDVPMAENASDTELARLRRTISAAEDRRRWEADTVLYGVMWPR